MTVGERAEDVFYLTDFDNRPLSVAAAQQLKERLMTAFAALALAGPAAYAQGHGGGGPTGLSKVIEEQVRGALAVFERIGSTASAAPGIESGSGIGRSSGGSVGVPGNAP